MPPNIFYGVPLVDWLKINSRSTRISAISEMKWGTIFPVAVWILWLHRNSIVFGKAGPHRSLLDETLARAAKVAYLVSNGNQSTIKNQV